MDNAALLDRLNGEARRGNASPRSQPDFQSRLGIGRRQWLFPEKGHSGDLAVLAAQRALTAADCTLADVDLLIATTSTPHRISSSLSAFVTKQLGAVVSSFDIKAGGAGALFAWLTSIQFLRHEIQSALIVAAEVPSHYRDPDDRTATALLGDGAGALFLRRTTSESRSIGLLGGFFETVPSCGTPWTVPGALPPTVAACDAGAYRAQTSDATYNQQLRDLRADLIVHYRQALPLQVPSTRWLLSNAPSLSQAQTELAVLECPRTELETTLQDHGYLGCAGPLVALHELRMSRRVQPEDLVLFTAAAGGIHRGWLAWRT